MLSSLVRLWPIFRPYRGRFIVSQVILAIAVTMQVVVLFLNAPLVDEGIRGGDIDALLRIGLTMLALAVVAGILLVVVAGFAVFFGQGLGHILRVELYRKVQTFSFAEYDRFRTGTLLSRLNADVTTISTGVMFSIMLLLQAPIMLVEVVILSFLTSVDMALLLSAVVIGLIIVLAIGIPPMDRAYVERQSKLDGLGNVIQENVAGSRVVKAFVREELENEKFRDAAEQMRRPAFKAAGLVAALLPIFQGFTLIGGPLLVGFGGQGILEGTSENTVGDVVAFTQYLGFIVLPLVLLAVVVPFLLRADASARRIFTVYEAESSIKDRPGARDLEPADAAGRVVFEDVTFAFTRPDGTPEPKPALRNINLTLEPGERVGILGATGSGKTALVNLLPRFYDVTSGRITIDGFDVRDLTKDSLRRTVGIALQEALLFRGSVRSNLSFAAVDEDQQRLEAAARAADAYGFVTNLPEKWDSPVARRGYNFSGGQRQRLSMARTLNAQPRILVLDDSTSALDVATESRVQAAIPEFATELTTIYVAQRISAVIDLDRVLLMDGGEIVAEGSHDDLLATSDLYRQIYESQLGPIEDAPTHEAAADEGGAQ